MKKFILLLIAVLVIFFVSKNASAEETIIPDTAIRFRVIANSNTVYDQNVKIQVRNLVQNELLSLIKDSTSIENTRNIILEHKEELYDKVSNKLQEIKYDKDFKIDYGFNHFPDKKYKGVTYKEGDYESLVITLGDGNGDNFWCVLFPPLCMLEENDNTSEVEYKFFITELIDKFFN
ncbi:MAG: stage II sporulation protein R [Bacilli bacterium]|nr:stage II sporulation protein R [Bacilli bacterium]